MSVHNKVVWSEGLFLQPQHFQQQDRYFERYIEARSHALIPHSWGFTAIEIERDLLGIGKFALRSGAGVFPDGTPFRMPDDDPLPAPLDIGPQTRDQILYLGLPIRRGDSPDIDRTPGVDGLARHEARQWEVRNVAAASADVAIVEVGALRTQFLLAGDLTQAYACIPLAHVLECRSDKQVVLDGAFMPTVLQIKPADRLAAFLTELTALVHQRADALGGRVASTSRGGAAEIADFLMLQALNRYEPALAHFGESGRLHPEELFRVFVAIAGELATFTAPSKRPVTFPPYRHDRLRESFDPVIAALRASLTAVLEQRAIPIPIEPKKYGIFVAAVADPSLYDTAAFILAARADVPAEELRRRFPSQLKIGPVERIRDLVNLQLPGVPIHPIPVAPRQIPFHAGFAYFELDQSHQLWEQLKTSGGVALQVAGEFPGLAMEFWAIRH